MATNFPTSVDVLTNPTANDSLNSPSHATQHANANDAIEAIENAIIDPANYPDQLVNATTATVRPLPFAIASGTVTLTGSATVTFPTDRFTVNPNVSALVNTTNGARWGVSVAVASPSSMTVYNWNGGVAGTASVGIFWTAIQMKSATAAG